MQAFGAAINLEELQAIVAFAFLDGVLAATGRTDWIFVDGGMVEMVRRRLRKGERGIVVRAFSANKVFRPGSSAGLGFCRARSRVLRGWVPKTS